jgi:hypothetical protein
MKSIIFLLLCLFPVLKSTGNGTDVRSRSDHGRELEDKKIRQFTIVENDTLSYTLNLVLDDSGRPQYFFRNIFTPVCYTNECKPVYVDFYWDLLGNYQRYEMPEGKIFTKVDHDEFKEEDYKKMADILSRPNSIFANLEMDDLITKGTDDLTDNVDAKTGATMKAIKNDVIEGAVYTCYTLWHIAYGKHVIAEMKKITESYLNDDLLHTFLSSNNYHYQYWAMDQVMDKNGAVKKGYEKDIENIISGTNLFTARTALQKVETTFFSGVTRQSWLWNTYQTSSYPLQIAILKKLTAIPINKKLSDDLAASILGANHEQFNLKVGILATQKSLPESTLSILAKSLGNEQVRDPEALYRILTKFPPQNKQTKAQIKQYKK